MVSAQAGLALVALHLCAKLATQLVEGTVLVPEDAQARSDYPGDPRAPRKLGARILLGHEPYDQDDFAGHGDRLTAGGRPHAMTTSWVCPRERSCALASCCSPTLRGIRPANGGLDSSVARNTFTSGVAQPIGNGPSTSGGRRRRRPCCYPSRIAAA